MTPLMTWGLQRLLGGTRQGRAATAGLGAAALLLGYLRSHRGPSRERIYAANLRQGETVRVRYLSGRTVVDETDVEG